MKIFSNITDDIISVPKPCILTIGFFDGLHLGHQKILTRILQKKENGTAVVVTFKNHPSKTLMPENIKKEIYNLDFKLKLLEEFGVDIVLLLEFTKELSLLDYQDFLTILFQKFSFSSLILGENACFGKDRLGNKENITKLTKKLGIETEFLPEVIYNNQVISSSLIRRLITQKEFIMVEKMLNRFYKRGAND